MLNTTLQRMIRRTPNLLIGLNTHLRTVEVSQMSIAIFISMLQTLKLGKLSISCFWVLIETI